MGQGLESRKVMSRMSLMTVILLAFTIGAFPQEDKPPSDVVPPPLSKLSKKTVKQLQSQKSLKSRTKLVIELMRFQVASSSKKASERNFEAALEDVGKFRGLMFHMRKTLLENRGKPSFRNNKRFEIALRRFVPSLEKIRRELPFRYGYHVKRLIKDVQEVRGDLLDSFFADSDS